MVKDKDYLKKIQQGEMKSADFTRCLNVLFFVISVYSLYFYFAEVKI